MAEIPFFEKLRKQLGQQLPFVAYRKPEGGQVKAFLQQDEKLHTTTDFSESGFVFAPFDTSGRVVLFPEKASEKLVLEASALSEKEEKPQREISAEVQAKERHIKLVEKALWALKAGEMDKVVLSRKEEVKLEGQEAVELFRRLLLMYSTAFVYLWYHPKVGLWLGATPETLLKVQGDRFQTMALAGTQKYTGTLEVEWGEKEKEEQRFVTDSIIENLKKSGVEKMEISAAYTAKAGNLLHLRTDIHGILKSTDAPWGVSARCQNIIFALHPTPAVCGLPKEKAKEFLLSEEGYDREFYTGFLGELNMQQVNPRSRTRRNVENLAYRAVRRETDLYVNLRCMKLVQDTAVLFVGGGITKDSNAEAEWEETVNKSRTMKEVLFK